MDKASVGNVMYDQWIRLRALKCWFRTQRSVIAWVVGVHGFLEADEARDHGAMSEYRVLVRDMMLQEIANSKDLLELMASGIEFMATTDQQETPLIHGRNLDVLLNKRLSLMRAHLDDQPFIDSSYMQRKAAQAAD